MPQKRKRRKGLELRMLDEWSRLDAHAARAKGSTRKQLLARKSRIGGIIIKLQSRA